MSAVGVHGVQHAAAAGTAHYTMVAADGVPVSVAAAAVRRLGGRVLRSNDTVGMLSVEGPDAGFVEAAAASPALVGAAGIAGAE